MPTFAGFMALFNLNDLSHSFGGAPVLDHINFQVDPGERVCLVGRNGAGKSTLMRIIASELAPDSGAVSRQLGAHFARLSPEVPTDIAGTVHDLVSGGGQPEEAGGAHEEDWQREMRIEQLMERMQLPVRTEFASLSGGLRRRTLIARALAGQPDLLLLDEPTNDLDAETLELLENLLVEFSGTLLLVSHDREFLDNVVTSTLVFEGDGRIGEYIGGCSDWLALEAARSTAAAAAKTALAEPALALRPAKPRKLTQKEQRELEALPPQIEQLEAEQAELAAKLADPGFYQREPGALGAAKLRLESIEQEMAAAFARWEELKALRAGIGRTDVPPDSF